MSHEVFKESPFAALLDAAVDGIIIISSEGLIEVVNPAVQQLFGYESGELIGRNISVLMPPGDREHHDGYISHYLKTGVRKMIGIGRETTGQKKDQSCFPLYLSVGRTDDDEQVRFVGIIRDLTQQKQEHQLLMERDQEVSQLREKLVHVSRISTLGEMVTGIAHEVNQPLTAIATYTQACMRLINSGNYQSEQLLEALERTSHQAQRAAKVITRIRNFAKKSQIVRNDYDCNELLTEVVALAQIYADEMGVNLVLDLAADEKPLMVVVDIIQTQQVALNLMTNAIESMVVAAKNPQRSDREVVIRTRRWGQSMVDVSIIDSGEGIHHDLEQQIFDPFFSTKETGLGMGLSICQSIVHSQGGKLTFKHNPDRGCTFSFTLPTSIGEIT
jgi:two-component system, LuxR family, sensor kinase FixL